MVYGAEGAVGRWSLRKTYDLVFTDHRLVGAVVAKTGLGRAVGSALGGPIGGAIGSTIAKRGSDEKRPSYEGLSLEQIVASDDANFAAGYETIENPKVKGLVSKSLHMKVGGKKAVFKLPKNQLGQVKQIVAQTILPRTKWPVTSAEAP